MYQPFAIKSSANLHSDSVESFIFHSKYFGCRHFCKLHTAHQAITIPNYFDISPFCVWSSSILFHTMASAKIISMSVASNKLNNLFDLLDKIHPKTIKSQRQYNIHGWLSITKRTIKLYFLMLICMVANFVCIPLCIRLAVFINTGIWKVELVMKMWLHFETKSLFSFTVIFNYKHGMVWFQLPIVQRLIYFCWPWFNLYRSIFISFNKLLNEFNRNWQWVI